MALTWWLHDCNVAVIVLQKRDCFPKMCTNAKKVTKNVWKPESTVILPAVLLVAQHVPANQIEIEDQNNTQEIEIETKIETAIED